MKKIAIALALSASMALIACGEEAKKEETKTEAAKEAPAKKAEAPKEEKKEEAKGPLWKALEKKCNAQLAAKDDKEVKAAKEEFKKEAGSFEQAKINNVAKKIEACVEWSKKRTAAKKAAK